LDPRAAVIERLGGDAVDSLSRSHRISSHNLQKVTHWAPEVHGADRWKELP
jgi:hypothetical protein